MAGIYNEAIMPRYIEMGARFILSGQDAAFLMARRGAADRVSAQDAGLRRPAGPAATMRISLISPRCDMLARREEA